MRVALLTASVTLGMLFSFHWSIAQDSTSIVSKLTHFPNKFLGKINKKANELNSQLDKQTEKYLAKLSGQEATLKKKLYKVDSATAKRLFPNNIQQQYALWLQKIKSDTSAKNRPATGEYYPYMDSLRTSLSFLKQNPQLLDPSKVS